MVKKKSLSFPLILPSFSDKAIFQSTTTIQTLNLVSSCLALALMILGLIHKEWTKVEKKPSGVEISSSPWIICSGSVCAELSTDQDNTIWNLMVVTVCLSVVLCLILGMDHISLIPRFKARYFIFGFISFLTGVSLFTAIVLYNRALKTSFRGHQYVIINRWIFHSTYVIIFLYLVCGILCLLSHTDAENVLNFEDSPKQSTVKQPCNVQMESDSREKKGILADKIPLEDLEQTKPIVKHKFPGRRVTWNLDS
ncbi:transmembrane protein 225 isoform X2 [Antechinus flavipes]|uniref:transmembrane protein 225 isoform X2 n=1 Tax=Antechinus flavipes TaxID=38775 RepID=UPI00223612EC|nr:transmembrane protein 225 isoform X2 [Antechinus flavipes]